LGARSLSWICWRSESRRNDDREKYNRVDLLAKTDDDRIIIEVQYLSEMAYLRCLTYGTAKTIVESIKLGEPYTNVRKVYSISLLYFDISDTSDDYICTARPNSGVSIPTSP